MAHHSPEQVWADWWVRLPARCCACCLLQGADATLIRTGRRHHPKALADGRWREKEPDQQRLCQQPHLALLALASLPRGGAGGRTEKPAPRGPTLEGHQGSEAGGKRRTSVAFFPSRMKYPSSGKDFGWLRTRSSLHSQKHEPIP